MAWIPKQDGVDVIRADDFNNEFAELEEELATQNNEISIAKKDIASNKTALSQAQKDIAANETAIKNNEDKIKDMNIKNGESEGSVQTINSTAQTENSFAEGNGTIAGGRAFDIVNAASNDDGTGYFEIKGSTNGFEVGDVFSYQLSNNYDFYGTITSFEDIPGASDPATGTVSVHGAIQVDKITIDTKSSGGSITTGTFWIPSKPTLGTKAWGVAAHSSGYGSIASAVAASTEGYNNISGGKYSHTENRDNEAGYAAHAEGQNTKAHAPKSHTEGEGTKVFAEKGHAEGHFGKVTGVAGHTEGWGTETNGKAGHSEGISCITNGDYGHSEGNNTRSNGDYSHAQNRDSIANGDGSSASGLHTIANGEYQNTQGKFNKEDFSNKYAHIVGNGTAWNKRSNAHTVDWNGVGWFAGGLKVGGTGQDDANAVDVIVRLFSLETSVGDISAVLDAINGEVV